MIQSTELCYCCGVEFDYTAESRYDLIVCPNCGEQLRQCNLCTESEMHCNDCRVDWAVGAYKCK